MLESHYYKDLIEAGCDEAGRGCLAGSVYAAAVILPPGYQNEALNDSKQLTDKRRKALRKQIERDAVAWAVGTGHSISSRFVQRLLLWMAIVSSHTMICLIPR